MAYFAKVNGQTVVRVISASQEFVDNYHDGQPGEWIQTSFNTWHGVHYDPVTKQPDGGVALRKNFAGIGYTYDRTRDAFIPPKPFSSWTLNEDTCDWDPPTPYPNDGKHYIWNEPTKSWEIFEE